MNRTELEQYRSYLLLNINRFNSINVTLNASYPPKKDVNLTMAGEALRQANVRIDEAIRIYEIILEAVEGDLK